MEFTFRVVAGGGMDFCERNRAHFKQFLANNVGALCKITPVLPESGKQRRYFEGALVPLICWYQEGMDHRNADDRARVREWLKVEFNGVTVLIAGEAHKIPRSTRGREVLNRFVEDVVAWLIENYAPPPQALEPASFKQWRDTVMDGPDNYIDYLVSQGIL